MPSSNNCPVLGDNCKLSCSCYDLRQEIPVIFVQILHVLVKRHSVLFLVAIEQIVHKLCSHMVFYILYIVGIWLSISVFITLFCRPICTLNLEGLISSMHFGAV
jgi:hypothetical protein